MTTSHGWRIARMIFALGKIHLINPISIIDNGNLSMITFCLSFEFLKIYLKYSCLIISFSFWVIPNNDVRSLFFFSKNLCLRFKIYGFSSNTLIFECDLNNH